MFKETDLYLPIKAFLEGKGYTVKSEIKGCDIVASIDDDLVVIELKKGFTLDLVLQGVERKSITDYVYLAIPRPKSIKGNRWRKIVKLCRMLSLGLIIVAFKDTETFVEVAVEPGKYTPQINKKKQANVSKEFNGRITDFNLGGSTKTPILTAYKENALIISLFLKERGPTQLKDIKAETGIEKAGQILGSNVYNWYKRVKTGVYDITDKGIEGLVAYDHAMEYLKKGSIKQEVEK
ncbi:hypothetical protein HYG86_12705 [Alkalicella caledoniensis]|uniref:Uncharacterized protein n=1 Tax=Alkalicella caledoniensis TaxID=2731377 RepID=A0A7G9WA56_ALKCA|nr:DUF2161 family putative PD-(D/E)XK-type phosphodiesterase [Alkalicella caledoniensis]QNO15568.1 hypothetical protein HYG86_12705 [Alkalicella caledoniensis]